MFSNEKNLFYNSGIAIDKSDWDEVFSACLGKAMANQNAFAEIVVKDRDWNVEFGRQIISFGDDEFPVQFIGSESASSNSWLWGWENLNGFSDNLIKIPNFAKEKGLEWKLEPLTTAGFDITDIFNGHTLSIVASSIYDENVCYYRGPHSGGAILVAVQNLPQEVFAPVDSLKFTQIAMDSIRQFDVDHEIFIKSFLYQNHTAYECGDKIITAHFEKDLNIYFEDVGEFKRITNIKN